MHVPMTAGLKNRHHGDVGEPIKCAVALKPTAAQRHNRELVRHFVVVIALLAVLLLIAIAFYYTEGNSVTVKRINSLATHHPFARLS
jgi:hypothetical protein